MDANVIEEMAMVREALGTMPDEMTRRQFLERWWRTPEALRVARNSFLRGKFAYGAGMT